ncbi:MAG TPA: translation initiation factor IF-3 [Methanosarcinales archaeon]|nr:translation initiation factor IF-3 [Methanosarcinales archaeon]
MPFVIKYADFQTLKLLDTNNVFHNGIHISKAKEMAAEAGLDLVCFTNPSGNELALCKIIDYGKWKYNEEKRKKKLQSENKRQNKEIRFSPVIDDNDVKHKVKQACGFIDDNCEVTFFMKLKGRQRSHFNEAEDRMTSIIQMCENAKEISRKKTGNSITVRLSKK